MTNDNPIAVCLLTETYYPIVGGGETQAGVLASGFARNGSVVNVLTRRIDAGHARSEERDGATIWRLSPTGTGHLKKWGLVFTALLTLWRLRREYDLILVAGYRVLGIPSIIAAKVLGKPCILKADSIGELSGEFFNPGLQRFHLRHDRFPVNVVLSLRNWLLRHADRFVAISTAISDELVRSGVRGSQIVAIPNSVDTNRFHPVSPAEKSALRRSFGIAPGRSVGIYTGRLVTTKGLPLLLQSWRRIVARHPDALLLLVGAGGVGLQNCVDQLRQFVSVNQLEQSVWFVGNVIDVHRYLQASDFFVFPTEREAFGISIIEALACELPVITTATGGIKDIVANGDISIVIPVGDEHALTSAAETVIRGGAAIDKMAKAARQVTVEHYSEVSILNRYSHLFSEVCRPVPHE